MANWCQAASLKIEGNHEHHYRPAESRTSEIFPLHCKDDAQGEKKGFKDECCQDRNRDIRPSGCQPKLVRGVTT